MMKGKTKGGLIRVSASLQMVMAAILLSWGAGLADEGFRDRRNGESRPWDLRQTLQQAEVVLACTHEISGEELRFRIERVVKQNGDRKFAMTEGEIVSAAGLRVSSGVSYGEKSIVFLRADQKIPWRTAYVHQGKVRAFGDISLENLIEFAEEHLDEED